MGWETAEPSLPEQEDVLAVERHVGVRWQEPRAQEGVRAVGGFLPEDVRERDETKAGGRHERLGRVRPEAELPVDRAERVADVDREDPAGDENALALGPRIGQHAKHPGVVGRAEGAEEPVPLRDHRVRRRSEHQMDRPVRDPAQPARVAMEEPNGPPGWAAHGRPKPWHG